MRISKKDWLNYVKKLRRLDEMAADKMLQYINRFGVENTTALINYAYALATRYGEGAATLAAEMYDAIAELSGRRIAAAVPAETATYSDVAKAVNGTLKTGNNKVVCNAVGTLVKRAGADTMLKNTLRDGAQFAWIPNGDTCAFCLTLASRGWQTASKDAIKNGHAEHIHANCDCTYAVRFDENLNVEGYNPDEYLEMYEGAEGIRPKDKINALRRQKYQENADKIREQKRAAYAARKERENEGKPDAQNKN